MKRREILIRAALLIIVLYFFLLSIKLMGSSFKLFGSGFAETLLSLTANPFVGLFIGILATSIVQSSSCTTSIVVGLTASGAITVGAAVPIIMGANIGTSITNTIVSLAHLSKKDEFKKAFEVATVHDFFNFVVVIILFPIEIYFHFLEKVALFLTSIFLGSNLSLHFTSPLHYIINPIADPVSALFTNSALLLVIFSLVMLFISLRYIVKIMTPFAKTEFKHLVNKHIFNSPLRAFGVGLILTAVVQSSSVTTSLIVPLAGVGIVTLEKVFAYILGANVGTTVTALMASLVTGSPAAVTVALEHVLFNCLGSIIIYPMRVVPIRLSESLAHLSYRSKVYPFAYILFTFFLLPSFVILVFH